MIIRKARLGDVPEIASELWEKGLRKYYRRFPNYRTYVNLKKSTESGFAKFLRKNIRSRDSLLLVAEDRERLVAFSLNRIVRDMPVFAPKTHGYMSDFFVKKRYRGKGIATKFKKEAFRWFKKKGAKFVSLLIYTENKSAHKVYEKWGFRDYRVNMRRKI